MEVVKKDAGQSVTGCGVEIAARTSERHFDDLRGPVRRLGAPDVRFPASPVLLQAPLLDAAAIVDSVRNLIAETHPGKDTP